MIKLVPLLSLVVSILSLRNAISVLLNTPSTSGCACIPQKRWNLFGPILLVTFSLVLFHSMRFIPKFLGDYWQLRCGWKCNYSPSFNVIYFVCVCLWLQNKKWQGAICLLLVISSEFTGITKLWPSQVPSNWRKLPCFSSQVWKYLHCVSHNFMWDLFCIRERFEFN